MRFVTSYSLEHAWRGSQRIAAFQVIPGADGKGVRLIVNEWPYTGPAQAGQMVEAIDPDGTVRFAPVVAGPQSFVLADKLAYCRFTYLEPRTEPPLRIWRPNWVRQQDLPLGIRIDMAPLTSAPSEVKMSTVTAMFPVNPTNLNGNGYTDAQR